MSPRRGEIDPLWEMWVRLVDEPITSSERSRLNRGLKELRAIGAEASTLATAIAAYRRMFPSGLLTPQAITGNWTQLTRGRTGWRWVRGSHGGTFIRDPNGNDQPPSGFTARLG